MSQELREFISSLPVGTGCVLVVRAHQTIVAHDLITLAKNNCIILPNLNNMLKELEDGNWVRQKQADGSGGTRIVTIRKPTTFDLDWFMSKLGRSIVDFGHAEKFKRRKPG